MCMKFKGTVVITDPCYFVKDEDWNENIWDNGDLGSLGFSSYICRPTIYGDWGCKTYQREGEDLAGDLQELFEEYNWRGLAEYANESKVIGRFCADAGTVAVVLLEDLKKYNPDVIPHLRSNMVTIIENYDGEIEDHVFLDKHVVIIGDNFFTLQD